MISSRVRHNKTHPNGHHDVHARQTRDRRGKNRQNFYLQPEWRSSAVPVQPFMSRVGRVSDGTCTKRKMFDLPRTPNGGCVAYDRRQKVWGFKRKPRGQTARPTSAESPSGRLRLVASLHSQVASCPGLPVSPVEQKQRNAKLRHLTKWAGAAVRMGQQGGQTEALWTHLDPSKPQERLHAPAGAHARSAATCHNHTEQEASDHLHLQLKTTFSVKTTFRKEKKGSA